MSAELTWPPAEGELRFNVPLAPTSWLRVGGPALAYFQPADEADLAAFIKNRPSHIPIFPIGVASNLLIRDGGLDAVVVRLTGPLAEITVADNQLIAGAGALDQRVAQVAARAGLGGLEFMIGIPGTIGGAITMNAGAFGGETAENLLWIEILDAAGGKQRLPKAALNMRYRHSALPEGCIVLRACFECQFAEPAKVKARMAEIKAEREAAQPLRVATGGSTFKNPEGHSAWRLIDAAGCRGMQHGHASVSTKHCNFLINDGAASAQELEELGELVRAKVKADSGIELTWEIKRVGTP